MTKLTKENAFELLSLLSLSKGEFKGIGFNGHERKNPSIKDDNNVVFKDGEFIKMSKVDISEELLKFVVVSNKKLNAVNVTGILGQALNDEPDPNEIVITVTTAEETSDTKETNTSEETKQEEEGLPEKEKSEVIESSSTNKLENKTDKKDEEKFEHNPDPKNTALLDWLFSVAA